MALLYKSKRIRKSSKLSILTKKLYPRWLWLCAFLAFALLSILIGLSLQHTYKNNESLRGQISVLNEYPQLSPCLPRSEWKSNETRELTVNTPNGERSFLVHVHNNFKNHEYYPVVVVYPGRGADAQSAQRSFGLDNLPAIVVYPSPTIGITGDFAWQGAPYSSKADDVTFTDKILEKLRGNLCIDSTKIYAIGFSNGGGFVSMLPCAPPDRFAAYAIIAGALYEPNSNCFPQKDTSFITVHGDKDMTVPYKGDPVRRLPPVPSWIQARASAENCTSQVSTSDNVHKQTTTWTNCSGGEQIRSERIIGGTHRWGDISNLELWRFLIQFSR